MSKCKNCNLEILDATDTCPFCHCILEKEGEGVDTYPDVRGTVRRFRFFENLILFLSILAECIMLYINYVVTPKILWSLVVGLILIYVNVLIRFAIIGKAGYLFKTLGMVLIAVAVLVGIDLLTGHYMWSLNFVLPSGILLIDFGIVLLMIINHRNWQSYMMAQIFTILLGLFSLLLVGLSVITVPFMSMLATAVSVFLFLGTFLLGDQRAKTELKRRFHI